jgi:hypothetical protein
VILSASKKPREKYFMPHILRNFVQLFLTVMHSTLLMGHVGGGGTIIIWKSSKFSGHTIFQNNFALSVELSSTLSGIPWVLTNVYAPYTPDGKQEFLEWFHNIDMPIDTDWLVVGDFNLIRRSSDRNRPGGEYS